MAGKDEQSIALDRYLRSALHTFRTLKASDDAARHKPLYIPVRGRHRLGNHPSNQDTIVDPRQLLCGRSEETRRTAAMTAQVSAPFLAVVTGEFGVGKTELLRQICRSLMQYSTEQQPCPINLANCLSQADILRHRAPDSDEMAELLFSPLFDTCSADMQCQLIASIRSGRRLLVLDGLDELVFDVTSHHNFFRGIANLLCENGTIHTILSRVLLSVRHEYLAAFDFGNPPFLIASLTAQQPVLAQVPVHFIRLDLFGDSQIERYLAHRLPHSLHVDIMRRATVRQLLSRPLLLRLFCDYVDGASRRGAETPFDQFMSHSDILEAYIMGALEAAVTDEQIDDEQSRIARDSIRWNADQLYALALEHYRFHGPADDHFELREVAQCVSPSVDLETADIDSPAAETVWRAIHKCPFLQKTGDSVRFSHQVFFQFAVAKALHAEARERTSFTAFDQLVLNVETRRLLRGLMGPGWRERTRHSYALDDWTLWERSDQLTPAVKAELEEERWRLLCIMTDPENIFEADACASCSAFINRLDRGEQRLNPRYVLYNCEAVAVFISHYGWLSAAQVLEGRFFAVLKRTLENTLKALRSDKPLLDQVGYILLLERSLSIALRLRYSWVRHYAQKRIASLNKVVIPHHDVWQRIEGILGEIRHIDSGGESRVWMSAQEADRLQK